MADYPDMREMARLATKSYADIDSLEQIRPPYPAQGTSDWWALRARYEELLFARIRRERNSAKGQLPLDNAKATAAKWTALGNEVARAKYEREGKPEQWWLERWGNLSRPKDLNVLPSLGHAGNRR